MIIAVAIAVVVAISIVISNIAGGRPRAPRQKTRASGDGAVIFPYGADSGGKGDKGDIDGAGDGGCGSGCGGGCGS